MDTLTIEQRIIALGYHPTEALKAEVSRQALLRVSDSSIKAAFRQQEKERKEKAKAEAEAKKKAAEASETKA